MASDDDIACPMHADFDPLSPTFLADPFAFLTSLQREASVFYGPAIGYYAVTHYAHIETVFLDHVS
jgi:cytochrome P450